MCYASRGTPHECHLTNQVKIMNKRWEYLIVWEPKSNTNSLPRKKPKTITGKWENKKICHEGKGNDVHGVQRLAKRIPWIKINRMKQNWR
jgi:hypothetical protein